MSVSLTLIVKNEAANIEACIASVREVVDEIVVCDTGSSDETVEIAQRLGATVVDFPWCDSFAAARNHAIENASCDWILVLDADDRIAPSEREKLRGLFTSLPDENIGYTLRCLNAAVDGGAGTDLVQVRLFRRRADIRWRYRVHEQIVPTIRESGGRFVSTDIRLDHVGYRDPFLVAAKSERNLRLIELDLADNPTDPFLMFYRGVILAGAGRHAEAIVLLNLCLAAADPASDMGRTLSMSLVRSLRAEGMLVDALHAIRTARMANPMDIALVCMEAELLIEVADVPGAAQLLAGFTEPREDLSIPDLRARALFGEALVELGHLDAAEEIALSVIAARPKFGPPWLVLADVFFAKGDVEGASKIAAHFETTIGGETARVIIQVAEMLHRGDHRAAWRVLETTSQTNPSALLVELRNRIVGRAGDLRPPLVSCLGSPWPEARAALARVSSPSAGMAVFG